MMRRVSILGLALVLPFSALAQSIRDKVKDHVRKELEDDEDKKGRDEGKDDDKVEKTKKKKKTQERKTSRDRGAGGEHTSITLTEEDLLADPKEEGPELPIRVFGKKLGFDLKADSGYRGWYPQQYDSADVDVGGYYTWSTEARAKIWFINVHRGYYESNALNAPRTEEASVAATVGEHIPRAAWAMAMIGFPVFRRWEPVIRYEARAFSTTAEPKVPVCIVSRETSTNTKDCTPTTDRLSVISSFETLVIGVQHNPPDSSGALLGGHKGKTPPIYAGLGLMAYNKPYQVTIDGATLGDFLFDGRFRGAGLALGTRFGGRVGRPFGHVNMQLGLGEVSLTDDLTLNELAPKDWLIGYIQGDVGIGYRYPLVVGPPALILNVLGTGGGASFHFISGDVKEEEEGQQQAPEDHREGSIPSVNWDFLWSVRVALELAF